MSARRHGRCLALRAGPSTEPVAGVVHVESCASCDAPGRVPAGPRAPGLRRLHLRRLAPRSRGGRAARLAALGVAAAACTSADAPARDAALAADVGATVAGADDFRPGFDPRDSASAALAAFLDASIGADAPTPAQLAHAACGLGAEPVFPTELLAAFAITGRSGRGDTVVVRASVVTAAEQNADRRLPGRYVGSVRERRGEWEWDVVRAPNGWRVCAGPTFGLHAPDTLTTWRPDGASAAAARALAARIARRAPASDGSGAAPAGGGL